MTERGLERRFGPSFTARLAELPAGVWSGPVASHHGAHLVFVHERRPGRLPELAEERGKVLARWHEAAAERWLAERVRQLRAEYEVVLESGAASVKTRVFVIFMTLAGVVLLLGTVSPLAAMLRAVALRAAPGKRRARRAFQAAGGEGRRQPPAAGAAAELLAGRRAGGRP